jgi:hypothetical protein
VASTISVNQHAFNETWLMVINESFYLYREI